MDENIKHHIRKKRGAPKKTFTKPNQESDVAESTESPNNQNLSEMADDNEFYNEIGNENEVRSSTTPPITENDTNNAINVEATVMEEADAKNKNTEDPLLTEDVAAKPYAAGLTDTSKIPTTDIPEAKFVMPKGLVDDTPPEKTQQIPKAEPIQPLNKDAETLSPAEKRRGAELTVEGFWTGYEKLNFLLGSWLQTSSAKRVDMHNKKELDLNMKVKVSIDGTQVTVNEFYEQMNEDIKETFSVDPKLKERLFEPMCREAEKMGLVMTDRQFILKELGQDIITKLMQFLSINNNIKSFTKAMKDSFAQDKKEREAAEVKRVAHEEKMSRMIDPDSDEGQEELYRYYQKLRSLEINAEEKARRMSEAFKEEESRNATTTTHPERKEAAVHSPVVETTTTQAPATSETTATDKNESNEIQVYVEEVKDDKK